MRNEGDGVSNLAMKSRIMSWAGSLAWGLLAVGCYERHDDGRGETEISHKAVEQVSTPLQAAQAEQAGPPEAIESPADKVARIQAERAARTRRIDELKQELAHSEIEDVAVREELIRAVQADFKKEAEGHSYATERSREFRRPPSKTISDDQRAELDEQMSRYDMSKPADVAAYAEAKARILEERNVA